MNLVTVLDETIKRDDVDSGRTNSPLKSAEDAWQLNTDGLEIQEVVQQIVERIKTL